MTPQEALAAYREELAAAGVSPLETSPLQEAILQALVLTTLVEEAKSR